MRRTIAVLSLLVLVAGISLAVGRIPAATSSTKLGPQHAATAGMVQIMNRIQQNQAPMPALPKTNPTDDVLNCYPQAVANWTGSVNSGGTRTDNSMVRGVGMENGYFCFDISGIPSGAIISSVVLNAYLNSANWPYYAITRMTTTNPVIDAGSAVYTDADYYDADGNYVDIQGSSTYPTGWYGYDLGAAGITDLTTRKAGGNFFPVGVCDYDYYSSYYVIYDGWNQSNIPYLTVTYTVAGGTDAAVTALGSPNHGCELWVGGTVPVSATVMNLSAGSQTFNVTATDGAAYTSTQSVTLGSGASQLVTFGSWSPTVAGPTGFMVYTQLAGDANAANDTLHFTKNISPISDYTIQYDNDVMENGYYFYEAYPEYVMATAYTPLSYPCIIDRVAVTNISKYNAFNMQWPDATFDSFRLQIWFDTDNDGAPEEPPVWMETIKADSFYPNDWVSAIPLQGSVVCQSGNFWVGMINAQGGGAEALGIGGQANAAHMWTRQGINETDWIQGTLYGDHMMRAYCTSIHYDNDLALAHIVTPAGLGMAGTVTPSVYVKNMGNLASAAASVAFDVPTAAYSDVQPVPALAPSESVLITFADWTTTTGAFPMTATVTVAGDENPANDVANATYSVADWYENFDVNNGMFTTIGANWQWGVPTYAGGPTSANSLPNCWGINLAGIYPNNANDRLDSRQLVALTDNPTLFFYMWVDAEAGWDGMNLKYSTDGTNYTLITNPDPPYNGTAIGLNNETVWQGAFHTWRLVTATIPVTTGQSFYVRWHFGSDGSVQYIGTYVDDVAGVGLRPALLDVGVSQIISPPPAVNPGSPYNVTLRGQNYGEVPATFDLYAMIAGTTPGDTYTESRTGLSLAPGANASYNMPSMWIPTGGTYAMTAWTVASGDGVPANDTMELSIVGGSVDIACTQITVPGSAVDTVTPVIPAASFTNNGSISTTFEATFTIDDLTDAIIYTDVQNFTLAPGATQSFSFLEWPLPHAIGSYVAKCSVYVGGDNNIANNVQTKPFSVRVIIGVPGWHAKTNVGGGAALVKDGGAMAYNADEGLIYEMKGNKTLEFNCYNPVDTNWMALAPIPAGLKPVKGGASMATGAGKVFVTKGNNTLEFYRYSIADSAWLPATKTVPLGAGKKVKAGGSMAFVSKTEGDFVYLLKGYGTEFYRYDVTNDSFTPLAAAPAGIKPKYDKGSWIAYDGSQWLYVMKSKYGVNGNEFYKYDVQAEAWSTATLSTIPLVDPLLGKKKKVGDGSCAAWGNDALYALKGNNNNTFWKYSPLDSTWAELETVPQVAHTGDKKKKVKGGAAIVSVGDIFYAQKGNKVNQFWQYVPGTTVMAGERAMRDGVAAGNVTNVTLSMAVSPNPLATGYATLRYSLPKSGVVMMNVYDVTGRSVMARTLNTGRTGSTALDLRNLSAGVYLVKLSSDSFSTSQKLVVER